MLLENESETRAFAVAIALVAKKGDLITLTGDLGVGKTFFAREFIRHYLSAPNLEVPSPTYLLSIDYGDQPDKQITHMDLYRINNASEIEELGLEEALQHGIVLLEWANNAEDTLPVRRLDISFDIINYDRRKISLSGDNSMINRFSRSTEISHFLKTNWAKNIERIPFDADASARKYEFVKRSGEVRILMDDPKTPDGPPIKDGLPYSKIAHLAEEIRPFVAISEILRANKFCAPKIFASDFDAGLVLLEYLGKEKIIDDSNHPIEPRYIASGKLLAYLHQIDWPQKVPMLDNIAHEIPRYDENTMMIEADLLAQWYLKANDEFKPNANDIEEYSDIWKDYARKAQEFKNSLVLRDYHSPNIIWREKQELLPGIGLIDFQDAMIGPAAYDLVSLAQDARVVVSPQLEHAIKGQYQNLMLQFNPCFDSIKFEYEYAMMGALRTAKVLGFCVRVDVRDGKPQYRKLIPSVRNYLKRNLNHPELSRLRTWCERVINL